MATDFAEALSTGLTDRTHIDEDDMYGTLLAALMQVAGSGAAAARTLGVSPTTFYRWRSGRSSRPGGRPQQPSVAKSTIVKAIRAGQLPAARRQAIRTGARTMKITGLIAVSNDVRVRTIHPGRDFPARVQARILDTWLAGEDQRAEDITHRAIERYYAPGMDIQTVTSVEWE